MTRFVSMETRDIRFPTSVGLHGSDAMNPAPDYNTWSVGDVTVMPLECHRDQGQRRSLQADPASGVPGQLLRPGTPTVSPH